MPGSPSTGVPATRPAISGLPGRIAIFQKSSSKPRSAKAACTRSWSPTLAPPVVTSMSAPPSESTAAPIAAAIVRRHRQDHRLAPAGAHQRGHGVRVGADDAARCDRLARHGDLVAGRQDGDAGPAVHGQPGVVAGRGQADIARAQPPAGLQQHVARR